MKREAEAVGDSGSSSAAEERVAPTPSSAAGKSGGRPTATYSSSSGIVLKRICSLFLFAKNVIRRADRFLFAEHTDSWWDSLLGAVEDLADQVEYSFWSLVETVESDLFAEAPAPHAQSRKVRKAFQNTFQLPPEEALYGVFGCIILSGNMGIHGLCYLSEHYLSFCAGHNKRLKVIIPFRNIVHIDKAISNFENAPPLFKLAPASASPMVPKKEEKRDDEEEEKEKEEEREEKEKEEEKTEPATSEAQSETTTVKKGNKQQAKPDCIRIYAADNTLHHFFGVKNSSIFNSWYEATWKLWKRSQASKQQRSAAPTASSSAEKKEEGNERKEHVEEQKMKRTNKNSEKEKEREDDYQAMKWTIRDDDEGECTEMNVFNKGEEEKQKEKETKGPE
ncbi:RING-type domain-containing protein [Balamuthia mandrillaris]